ncbi:MAG: kinase-like domain-containing protein [Piptocephalis tieghemiana]|nr:MAG: kinase-like domain-containing protein [Piptocephalis tieghemiana]
MTNAVYHVRLLNVLPPHPGFILRVYGSNADLIISRVREMLWLERLSASGVGSTMLGTFENGRVEAYLPSHTLTDIDIRIPETSRTIAREMRRLHDLISLYPPGLTDREGGERALEWRRCVDAWLPEVIKVIHSSHSSGFLSQQQVDLLDLPSLSPLISQYRAIAHNHPSGTVVSHNDVQYGNILRLDKDHSIVLVDFEYAGYNPKTYDIANHFNEWTADYYGPTPHLLNEAKYPSREERLNFLLAYTQGNSQEALLLEDLIPIWRTASHLFWGLWGLLQTGRDDVADFDYFAYGLGRIQQFRFAVRSLLEKDGLNDSGE